MVAGSSAVDVEDSTLAEIKAIGRALEQSRDLNLKPERLCTDCIHALDLLKSQVQQINMEYRRGIEYVKEQLEWATDIEMNYCPRELNMVADKLANEGRRNPVLSLYHRGSDKPRWLEDIIRVAGLTFDAGYEYM